MVNTEHFQIQHHLTRVIDGITRGQLVPFLGADINLCGRSKNSDGEFIRWEPDHCPPSNWELANYLDRASGFCYRQKIRCPLCNAKNIEDLPNGCPVKDGVVTRMALQHVSQIVDLTEGGPDVLYGALYELFQGKFTPNPVHQLFARLPGLLHEKGYYPPYPLIVSSCFDRTLEQALDEAGQKYDLVSYVGDQRGGYFEHRAPGEDRPYRIDKPKEYQGFSFTDGPVILKLYGDYQGKFVITEDQYIDYLAHRDIHELIPAKLLGMLRDNPILFLGYSPSYWNLRVILHRIWPEQLTSQRNVSWWAVQAKMEEIDKALWRRYHSLPLGVSSLDEYMHALEERLQDIPSKRHSLGRQGHESRHAQAQQPRDQVFVSYSHEDRAWLEKIKTILRPAVRSQNLAVWDDTVIQPGARWRDEIEKALAKAKVAILLVSANFLASDFIAEEEFPTLLEAAEKEGLKILWVYVSDCLYRHSAIADYQAAHNISQPLGHLPPAEQDAVLTQIGETVIEAMRD